MVREEMTMHINNDNNDPGTGSDRTGISRAVSIRRLPEVTLPPAPKVPRSDETGNDDPEEDNIDVVRIVE